MDQDFQSIITTTTTRESNRKAWVTTQYRLLSSHLLFQLSRESFEQVVLISKQSISTTSKNELF